MRRTRFSVASILELVALLALNLCAFKWAYSRIAASSSDVAAYFEGMISVGLIPVGNAVVVTVSSAARRRRMARLGLGQGARDRADLAFALCAASGMVLVVTLWAIAPGSLLAYFGVVNRPSMWLLRWSGLIRTATDAERPLIRFVIDPLFMALVLSGPLMLLAWIVGAFARKSEPDLQPAA